MSWFASLRAEADPIWRGILGHSFLDELGRGSLPLDRFRFFLTQDYPYLKEFSRVLGLAVSRGGRIAEMKFFAELLHATLSFEMDLHRNCCADLGIGLEELENARLAPAAYAYTRHLLTIGALGTQAEIAIALLPCSASYAEIGRSLAAAPLPEASHYAGWIRTYASQEYQGIANRLIAIADGLEAGASREERVRCREHFLVSSRYEYLFWEMAYGGEAWPFDETPH